MSTPAAEGVDGFGFKAVRGIQGGVSPWSQDEVREGEAANRNEVEKSVGRGKSVPPPRTHGGDGWSEDGDTLCHPSAMIIVKV